MQIIKIEANKAEIKFSLHEVSALTQVFNYAGGGAAKIDNFEQTIGVSRQKVREFCNYFEDVRNRIDPSSSIVKIIINRKVCNLRFQEYDLCFYMQKIFPKVENLKFLIVIQKIDASEIIIKTVWDIISLNQIHQDLSLLKDKANLFAHETDTISVSLFKGGVELNIKNNQLKESETKEESPLDIEIVFPKGIQISKVDSGDSQSTKKEEHFDTPLSFNSTLTRKNITNFITKVEDFFENKENNNHN